MWFLINLFKRMMLAQVVHHRMVYVQLGYGLDMLRKDAPMRWKKTTEARYWEMLGVLPPAAQAGYGFLVGEPMDHNREGYPRFSAFIEWGRGFYEAVEPGSSIRRRYPPISRSDHDLQSHHRARCQAREFVAKVNGAPIHVGRDERAVENTARYLLQARCQLNP